MSKPMCYVCDEPVESGGREVLNHRTGAVWHSHEGCNGPTPDSYAATARAMAEIFPDEDWDAWKDQMKEGDW